MNGPRFQRIAITAFIAVEILIFAGAVVRATGSGLGCPDWPFCYGCWLPPARAQDIDFSKLDLEKFRAKAARLGRDPASITQESLRAEFDPVSTWVEYLNRLASVPVGLSTLALFICGFGQIKARRPAVFFASATAFLLVLFNAWLGARVVISGLKPGIITLHLALAMLLLCILVFAAWRGVEQPWRFEIPGSKHLRTLVLAIFALVVIEGIMGAQVRELTDELARVHKSQPRAVWTAELEHSTLYLVHRSFSWLIFAGGLIFAATKRGWRWLDASIIACIIAQMLLGVVLSQVGIVRVAQVLHVGIASMLLSALFLWLLAARPALR